jgi:curved DNA binding protein
MADDKHIDADDEVENTEEDVELDISNSDVCTKYREAGKIANLALQGLVLQVKPGAKVLELCKFGDMVIIQKCGSIYQKKIKGKLIDKGVAFPTCVSVNECVCHNSPLESDTTSEVLSEGDLVKLDVGCYVDGYIAVAAHTMMCGKQPSIDRPLSGPQADVLHAAHIACEVAQKLLRPGNTNSQVTKAIAKVAEDFSVSACAGVLSHRMKRFVIDGNKVILLREDTDQKVEDFSFELNEVYSIDVAMSTGDGKPKEMQSRTTIFKRSVDKNYMLKMRSSRTLFNEINSKFPALPFTLRALDDERQARMGVVECLKHELIHPYPVLFEKKGDYVSHFKFTVLILPSGPTRITGLKSFETEAVKTEKTLSDDVNAIMSLASKKKKKKAKKKATGDCPV